MLSKSDCIALALNKRYQQTVYVQCAYIKKVNVLKTQQSINLSKKKKPELTTEWIQKSLYDFDQILEPES